jgi:murein L,D-transpeptidase YafK
MGTVIIIVATIMVMTLGALIWWYYPFVRNPWNPEGRVNEKLRGLCREAGTDFPPTEPRVVINKASRELLIYDGQTKINTYKIALGTNPVDDKRKEGDGCTPEGEFYICTKNDRSRFHLFLGLSYPNEEDAERGKKTRLINESEYEQINDAMQTMKRPPWDTKLGGEVGIHGGGADADWTLGCIALSNSDIEEVFMFVNHGTPVTITSE